MQESRAHPGAGRRSARITPKGRQVDPDARREVLALLGDRPLRRDLLVEHLHLIQDAYGCISRAHIAALAEEMRLAQTEVYEVATFYAHFDVTDLPVPKLTIRVCDSIACALAGAEQLADAIASSLALEGQDAGARIVRVPCVGRCDAAPVLAVGHNYIDRATPAAVRGAIIAGDTQAHIPAYIGYQDYVAAGGYRTLERLRGGELPADAVLDILDSAALRGLGGAGFPTGRKWRTVRAQPGTKLMTVNADEGEPGTFKDRWYLERDPHRFIEGMLIGANIVEATDVYIYLRDEYPAARQILQTELAKLPPGGPPIYLRRGAGAYICGDESAMIESIEGKRGLPRNKPPFVFTHGLFGRPTLVNNVETLWWVRDLIERGADWWNGNGRNGRKGLRSFSVSGRVREPGMKLAPAGIAARELIDEFCGGMAEGHTFRAYLPGGASGGILPASMADIPLDFGTLEPHGCFIGSAGIVVFSEADDLKAAVLNLMRFFRHESCGQCTPCRVGTEKATLLMEEREWNKPLLEELSAAMRDASICGLGQAAPNPVLTLMRYFPEEFSR